MSVFQKIFGAPAQPAAAPTPPAPPAPPSPTNNPANNAAPPAPHSSSGTAGNGVVPPGGNEGPKADATPIDKFSKVWETAPTGPTNNPAPGEGLTPEKMLEAASKVDFSKVLDQASLQKITAGGEEAVQALVSLLNKTAQTVYGQSTVVAKKLVDQAVEQSEARFAERIPSMVRRQATKDGLVNENPAFNHPAVAPFVEAIQQQLGQKYPNATATELQALAKEYFQGAAQVLNPAKPASKTSSGPEQIDWDSWVQ